MTKWELSYLEQKVLTLILMMMQNCKAPCSHCVYYHVVGFNCAEAMTKIQSFLTKSGRFYGSNDAIISLALKNVSYL